MDITTATQEPTMKMEANQEGKKIVIKPTKEVVVTQEPTAEVG